MADIKLVADNKAVDFGNVQTPTQTPNVDDKGNALTNFAKWFSEREDVDLWGFLNFFKKWADKVRDWSSNIADAIDEVPVVWGFLWWATKFIGNVGAGIVEIPYAIPRAWARVIEWGKDIFSGNIAEWAGNITAWLVDIWDLLIAKKAGVSFGGLAKQWLSNAIKFTAKEAIEEWAEQGIKSIVKEGAETAVEQTLKNKLTQSVASAWSKILDVAWAAAPLMNYKNPVGQLAYWLTEWIQKIFFPNASKTVSNVFDVLQGGVWFGAAILQQQFLPEIIEGIDKTKVNDEKDLFNKTYGNNVNTSVYDSIKSDMSTLYKRYDDETDVQKKADVYLQARQYADELKQQGINIPIDSIGEFEKARRYINPVYRSSQEAIKTNNAIQQKYVDENPLISMFNNIGESSATKEERKPSIAFKDFVDDNVKNVLQEKKWFNSLSVAQNIITPIAEVINDGDVKYEKLAAVDPNSETLQQWKEERAKLIELGKYQIKRASDVDFDLSKINLNDLSQAPEEIKNAWVRDNVTISKKLGSEYASQKSLPLLWLLAEWVSYSADFLQNLITSWPDRNIDFVDYNTNVFKQAMWALSRLAPDLVAGTTAGVLLRYGGSRLWSIANAMGKYKTGAFIREIGKEVWEELGSDIGLSISQWQVYDVSQANPTMMLAWVLGAAWGMLQARNIGRLNMADVKTNESLMWTVKQMGLKVSDDEVPVVRQFIADSMDAVVDMAKNNPEVANKIVYVAGITQQTQQGVDAYRGKIVTDVTTEINQPEYTGNVVTQEYYNLAQQAKINNQKAPRPTMNDFTVGYQTELNNFSKRISDQILTNTKKYKSLLDDWYKTHEIVNIMRDDAGVNVTANWVKQRFDEDFKQKEVLVKDLLPTTITDKKGNTMTMEYNTTADVIKWIENSKLPEPAKKAYKFLISKPKTGYLEKILGTSKTQLVSVEDLLNSPANFNESWIDYVLWSVEGDIAEYAAKWVAVRSDTRDIVKGKLNLWSVMNNNNFNSNGVISVVSKQELEQISGKTLSDVEVSYINDLLIQYNNKNSRVIAEKKWAEDENVWGYYDLYTYKYALKDAYNINVNDFTFEYYKDASWAIIENDVTFEDGKETPWYMVWKVTWDFEVDKWLNKAMNKARFLSVPNDESRSKIESDYNYAVKNARAAAEKNSVDVEDYLSNIDTIKNLKWRSPIALLANSRFNQTLDTLEIDSVKKEQYKRLNPFLTVVDNELRDVNTYGETMKDKNGKDITKRQFIENKIQYSISKTIELLTKQTLSSLSIMSFNDTNSDIERAITKAYENNFMSYKVNDDGEYEDWIEPYKSESSVYDGIIQLTNANVEPTLLAAMNKKARIRYNSILKSLSLTDDKPADTNPSIKNFTELQSYIDGIIPLENQTKEYAQYKELVRLLWDNIVIRNNWDVNAQYEYSINDIVAIMSTLDMPVLMQIINQQGWVWSYALRSTFWFDVFNKDFTNLIGLKGIKEDAVITEEDIKDRLKTLVERVSKFMYVQDWFEDVGRFRDQDANVFLWRWKWSSVTLQQKLQSYYVYRSLKKILWISDIIRPNNAEALANIVNRYNEEYKKDVKTFDDVIAGLQKVKDINVANKIKEWSKVDKINNENTYYGDATPEYNKVKNYDEIPYWGIIINVVDSIKWIWDSVYPDSRWYKIGKSYYNVLYGMEYNVSEAIYNKNKKSFSKDELYIVEAYNKVSATTSNETLFLYNMTKRYLQENPSDIQAINMAMTAASIELANIKVVDENWVFTWVNDFIDFANEKWVFEWYTPEVDKIPFAKAINNELINFGKSYNLTAIDTQVILSNAITEYNRSKWDSVIGSSEMSTPITTEEWTFYSNADMLFSLFSKHNDSFIKLVKDVYNNTDSVTKLEIDETLIDDYPQLFAESDTVQNIKRDLEIAATDEPMPSVEIDYNIIENEWLWKDYGVALWSQVWDYVSTLPKLQTFLWYYDIILNNITDKNGVKYTKKKWLLDAIRNRMIDGEQVYMNNFNDALKQYLQNQDVFDNINRTQEQNDAIVIWDIVRAITLQTSDVIPIDTYIVSWLVKSYSNIIKYWLTKKDLTGITQVVSQTDINMWLKAIGAIDPKLHDSIRVNFDNIFGNENQFRLSKENVDTLYMTLWYNNHDYELSTFMWTLKKIGKKSLQTFVGRWYLPQILMATWYIFAPTVALTASVTWNIAYIIERLSRRWSSMKGIWFNRFDSKQLNELIDVAGIPRKSVLQPLMSLFRRDFREAIDYTKRYSIAWWLPQIVNDSIFHDTNLRAAMNDYLVENWYTPDDVRRILNSQDVNEIQKIVSGGMSRFTKMYNGNYADPKLAYSRTGVVWALTNLLGNWSVNYLKHTADLFTGGLLSRKIASAYERWVDIWTERLQVYNDVNVMRAYMTLAKSMLWWYRLAALLDDEWDEEDKFAEAFRFAFATSNVFQSVNSSPITRAIKDFVATSIWYDEEKAARYEAAGISNFQAGVMEWMEQILSSIKRSFFIPQQVITSIIDANEEETMIDQLASSIFGRGGNIELFMSSMLATKEYQYIPRTKNDWVGALLGISTSELKDNMQDQSQAARIIWANINKKTLWYWMMERLPLLSIYFNKEIMWYGAFPNDKLVSDAIDDIQKLEWYNRMRFEWELPEDMTADEYRFIVQKLTQYGINTDWFDGKGNRVLKFQKEKSEFVNNELLRLVWSESYSKFIESINSVTNKSDFKKAMTQMAHDATVKAEANTPWSAITALWYVASIMRDGMARNLWYGYFADDRLLWEKQSDGSYKWGNKAAQDLINKNVAEMIWPALQFADRSAWNEVAIMYSSKRLIEKDDKYRNLFEEWEKSASWYIKDTYLKSSVMSTAMFTDLYNSFSVQNGDYDWWFVNNSLKVPTVKKYGKEVTDFENNELTAEQYKKVNNDFVKANMIAFDHIIKENSLYNWQQRAALLGKAIIDNFWVLDDIIKTSAIEDEWVNYLKDMVLWTRQDLNADEWMTEAIKDYADKYENTKKAKWGKSAVDSWLLWYNSYHWYKGATFDEIKWISKLMKSIKMEFNKVVEPKIKDLEIKYKKYEPKLRDSISKSELNFFKYKSEYVTSTAENDTKGVRGELPAVKTWKMSRKKSKPYWWTDGRSNSWVNPYN